MLGYRRPMVTNSAVPRGENRFFWFDDAAIDAILGWSANRIRRGPDPETGARPASELAQLLSGSIGADGIGSTEALRRFREVIVPSVRAQDDPMNLAYVPAAPTPAALAFDLAVSAAEMFGGTWEAGAGGIAAENQAIEWLAGLAGFGPSAGGTFVPGGTHGNLSALYVAREYARMRAGDPTKRAAVLTSTQAHSSVATAARVLDVELVSLDGDEHGRLSGTAVADVVATHPDVTTVVGSAGTTNEGLIDDLAGIGDVCARNELWFHVDGAYGLAAMASRAARPKFDGIELADSFVVDPHKWLFAPYDSCALVYRDPSRAVAANAQHAPYLDGIDREATNPADLAIQLSRRIRGLPLWFSLATYGTDRYAAAIDTVLATAAEIARGISENPALRLLAESDLSVVLFDRPGWDADRMWRWAEHHRRAGTILCVPTSYRARPAFRICVVNPDTDAKLVLRQLATMAED